MLHAQSLVLDRFFVLRCTWQQGWLGVRVGEASHPGPQSPCNFVQDVVRGTPVECAGCGCKCPRGMVAKLCGACGLVRCLRCGIDAGSACTAGGGLVGRPPGVGTAVCTRPSDFAASLGPDNGHVPIAANLSSSQTPAPVQGGEGRIQSAIDLDPSPVPGVIGVEQRPGLARSSAAACGAGSARIADAARRLVCPFCKVTASSECSIWVELMLAKRSQQTL